METRSEDICAPSQTMVPYSYGTLRHGRRAPVRAQLLRGEDGVAGSPSRTNMLKLVAYCESSCPSVAAKRNKGFSVTRAKPTCAGASAERGRRGGRRESPRAQVASGGGEKSTRNTVGRYVMARMELSGHRIGVQFACGRFAGGGVGNWALAHTKVEVGLLVLLNISRRGTWLLQPTRPSRRQKGFTAEGR